MKYYKVKAVIEVEMDIYCSKDSLDDAISKTLDEGYFTVDKMDSYDYSVEDDGMEWDIAHDDKVFDEMVKGRED